MYKIIRKKTKSRAEPLPGGLCGGRVTAPLPLSSSVPSGDGSGIIALVLHPNRTGRSGMVLCLAELGSGDLFCWNIAKPPGVTEKEKG